MIQTISDKLIGFFNRLITLEMVVTPKDIRTIEEEMPEKLTRLLKGMKIGEVVVIGIREGGVPTTKSIQKNRTFAANFNVRLAHFIKISSYREDTTSGKLEFWGLTPEQEKQISGRVIVLIDDLPETGRTGEGAYEYFMELGAKKVVFCWAFQKDTSIIPPIAKYVIIGKALRTDKFLFGYGLDFHAHLRKLRCVFGLTPAMFRIMGWGPLKKPFVKYVEHIAHR